MIDRAVWEAWMAAFTDRLGKPLEVNTQLAYLAEIEAVLDTENFEVAARRVISRHEYNTWPAAVAFLKAAPRHLHREDEGDAEIRATQKLLASGDAVPMPRADAVDQFAHDWRRQLADCKPRAFQLPPPSPDIWLSDERRDQPEQFNPKTRHVEPAPKPPASEAAA